MDTTLPLLYHEAMEDYVLGQIEPCYWKLRILLVVEPDYPYYTWIKTYLFLAHISSDLTERESYYRKAEQSYANACQVVTTSTDIAAETKEVFQALRADLDSSAIRCWWEMDSEKRVGISFADWIAPRWTVDGLREWIEEPQTVESFF